jgi:hypothetical protein
MVPCAVRLIANFFRTSAGWALMLVASGLLSYNGLLGSWTY